MSHLRNTYFDKRVKVAKICGFRPSVIALYFYFTLNIFFRSNSKLCRIKRIIHILKELKYEMLLSNDYCIVFFPVAVSFSTEKFTFLFKNYSRQKQFSLEQMREYAYNLDF